MFLTKSPDESLSPTAFVSFTAGKNITKHAPCLVRHCWGDPCASRCESSPWCPSIIFETMDSPRPTPVFLVVTNGLNICSCRSGGMPGPESEIRTSTALNCAAIARILSGPLGLDRQLATTRAHRIVSVLNDVHESLFTETFIHWHHGQISLVLLLDSHRRPFPKLSDIVQRAIEHRRNLLRSQIGMQGPRKVEETSHQCAESVRLGRNISGELRCKRIRTEPASGSAFRLNL